MTVHFIGAGPGDPDLITVRGQRLIQQCALCLYAGSLVPEAVVAEAPESARVIDTASMTLNDIMAESVPLLRPVMRWRGCIPVIRLCMGRLPSKSAG